MQVVRDPSQSSQVKEVNAEKQKVYTAILSDYQYLNANWYLSKHCRLTIFSWVSVPILEYFLDQ